MLTLHRGRVTAVVERHEGLARVEVDGVPCVAYPGLTGPVALGDEVLVNVQARELGLGSGGFDVLYANLTRGLGLPAQEGAHVMKLPYTPLQFAAAHVEEAAPSSPALAGFPVICLTLHSQLVPAVAALPDDLRVAYLQLPGGALPVPLSDALRALRARRPVTAVAVGASFGGEYEAVNVASGLAGAAAVADVAVCGIGPGIVGTASPLGHGAVAAAEAALVAAGLGASPILAVRYSEGDERERHQGVSHHTRAVLDLCAGRVTAAWPRGLEAPEWLEPRREVDVDGWREACAGLPLSHMGRGPDEEPWFFAAAYAAGVAAAELLAA